MTAYIVQIFVIVCSHGTINSYTCVWICCSACIGLPFVVLMPQDGPSEAITTRCSLTLNISNLSLHILRRLGYVNAWFSNISIANLSLGFKAQPEQNGFPQSHITSNVRTYAPSNAHASSPSSTWTLPLATPVTHEIWYISVNRVQVNATDYTMTRPLICYM